VFSQIIPFQVTQTVILTSLNFSTTLLLRRFCIHFFRRGLRGRDLAFVARNKRKTLLAQRFNLEQKAAILLAEEKQASREEEAMLRFLASMRLQSWWRGCLGKKAFQAAKHLVLMTEYVQNSKIKFCKLCHYILDL